MLLSSWKRETCATVPEELTPVTLAILDRTALSSAPSLAAREGIANWRNGAAAGGCERHQGVWGSCSRVDAEIHARSRLGLPGDTMLTFSTRYDHFSNLHGDCIDMLPARATQDFMARRRRSRQPHAPCGRHHSGSS